MRFVFSLIDRFILFITEIIVIIFDGLSYHDSFSQSVSFIKKINGGQDEKLPVAFLNGLL